MYVPKKFRSTDINEQLELVKQYPLATLVTNNQDGVEASHIPMLLTENEGEMWLQGHIARANPLWKAPLASTSVLAVFTGPNCYISPNLYPSKKRDGRAVPTWNYTAVHVSGDIEFITNPQWLLATLDQQTMQQEDNSPTPWRLADAPEDYLDKMVKAVVGFRIKVSNIVGKWKVSQNQPEENQAGVVAGLTEQGHDAQLAMAELVTAKSEA